MLKIGQFKRLQKPIPTKEEILPFSLEDLLSNYGQKAKTLEDYHCHTFETLCHQRQTANTQTTASKSD
jgi:hypothetical protein